MIHPLKSIQARQQGWVQRHFEKTRYKKELEQFKGIHQGSTCFIIGNGPSLSEKDLDKLYQNNVVTFGFNRIYLIFDKTKWRPTYYISQDEKTLKNCQAEVNNMNLEYKFIPLYHKYYHDIIINNAYYINLITVEKGDSFFSDNITKWIGNSGTVVCSAIQLAAFMGIKRIYLIGVDHNFSTYQNDKGEIINDNSVKDYFVKEYNPDKEELFIPNLDASTRSYVVCKNFCDAHGIEVFNATRGGKLEVFPRIDFDSIDFSTLSED